MVSAVAGTALFAAQAFASSYQAIENWGANDFFDHFDFFEVSLDEAILIVLSMVAE